MDQSDTQISADEMERNRADRTLLADAARRAGTLAMRHFRHDPENWSKVGGSPVCVADMEVDAFLRETLLAARPEYGWLSEETADNPRRLECRSVFVVDPIDGTRGFLAGDPHWCISIAVVRDGRPGAAVLFAPALDRLMTATLGDGASEAGEKITVADRHTLSDCAIAGPSSWFKSEVWHEHSVRPSRYLPSLAWRFASVADASFDAAFARPRAHDWDLAACDLLVHEAGGRLTALDGRPPVYNRAELRHGTLAAANPGLQDKLLAVLRRVEEERAARAGISH
ncbi:3'(2'),5'-bisphosphate nucleotidase CysQ [Afifella marina]|uniref:Myo-inositol-1(Or 4)-monophosphatase n=2 Tax=Afifella marina TaxID=1080 RepID=A0A1G5MB74_AFIMA|nr:3'(2'),5'-bisphosphate nucleotidase CysQ [Afifella marina]SCZ21758.1 myo-inositol-1(or 4)-monophosphatase [Afifella marina DSM 2698]